MSKELFNEKQTIAYDSIMAGNNVHLGGLGGCGKSFVLNVLREELGDRAVFLAPTGIAALNISGATIHSTFSLPLGVCNKFVRNKVSDKLKELFQDDMIKTIFIDEISMVRADMFAAIDQLLRLVKRKNIPFGGIQLVVVGDFGQLSPVLKSYGGEAEAFREEFDSEFCFTTEAWSGANMQHIELTEIIRQSDEKMISHLQKIHSKLDGYQDSLKYFNENCLLSNKIESGVDFDDIEESATFLTTTNKDAEIINEESYSNLDGEERLYKGKVYGSFRERPAPEFLNLKIGTKVMITANAQLDKGDYRNGEVGYVSDMTKDCIDVMISEEKTHRVKIHTWVEYEYKRGESGSLEMKEKSRYVQFPIKYGYAITIHKSQGCTLDKAIINIPRAFAHGQTYVALSRVKTIEGITLVDKIAPSDIIFSKDVRDFYDGKFNNILA